VGFEPEEALEAVEVVEAVAAAESDVLLTAGDCVDVSPVDTLAGTV
jgi:hypothetical protein